MTAQVEAARAERKVEFTLGEARCRNRGPISYERHEVARDVAQEAVKRWKAGNQLVVSQSPFR
jgi:hypothetical protein